MTLAYLAVQVRQNTAALKASSWQAAVSAARDANRLRSEPRTALAWSRGLTSFPNLDADDLVLFNRVMIDETLHLQGLFALRESGQLEPSTYAPYLTWFASIVATPGGTAWWESSRSVWVPAMVSAVEDRLSAEDLIDLRQLPGIQLPDAPGV